MVAAELESEVMELEEGTTFCCCPTKSRRPRVKPVPGVRGGWEEEEEEGDAIILLKESVEMPVVKGQKSAVQSWVEGLASMVLLECACLLCVCLCAGCCLCLVCECLGVDALLACCILTPPLSPHTLHTQVKGQTKLSRQTRRPCVCGVCVCVYVCGERT